MRAAIHGLAPTGRALGAGLGLAALLVGCNDDYFLPPPDLDASRVDQILGDAGSAEEGRGVYVEHCQVCHPADGSAGAGPGFAATLPDLDDRTVLEAVLEGRTGMPSFSTLTNTELSNLLAHLDATWRQGASAPTVASVLAATGDASNGRAAFDAYCDACHILDGTPGIGPSLVEGVPPLSDEDLVTLVLEGRGAMPTVSSEATTQELADLLAWLRDTYPPQETGDTASTGDTSGT